MRNACFRCTSGTTVVLTLISKFEEQSTEWSRWIVATDWFCPSRQSAPVSGLRVGGMAASQARVGRGVSRAARVFFFFWQSQGRRKTDGWTGAECEDVCCALVQQPSLTLFPLALSLSNSSVCPLRTPTVFFVPVHVT